MSRDTGGSLDDLPVLALLAVIDHALATAEHLLAALHPERGTRPRPNAADAAGAVLDAARVLRATIARYHLATALDHPELRWRPDR
jgi:hypothetical protein